MSVELMGRVFEHSQATGAARLVLLAMADEASSQGELSAYRRSQSWIAKKCRSSERSVRRCIDDLVALGELQVLTLGDGRKSSDYLITLPRADEASSPKEVKNGSREDEVSALREDTVSSPSSRCIPLKENSLVAQECDEMFERFWKAYPRRQGTSKKTARSAFKSALKRGHVDHIRSGLKRDAAMWAAERRSPEHIPHAATWLNQERYMPEEDALDLDMSPLVGTVVWLPGDQPAIMNADGTYTHITHEEAESHA